MSEPVRKTVKCQDPGDGSGDLIIEIPLEVLERINVLPDGWLTVEIVDGVLVLSAARDLGTKA